MSGFAVIEIEREDDNSRSMEDIPMMLLHQLCKIRGCDFGNLVQHFKNRLEMHMDAEWVDQIE